MTIESVVFSAMLAWIVMAPVLLYRVCMLSRYAKQWISNVDGSPLEQLEALEAFDARDHISWRNIFDLTKWRYSDYFPPRRT